MRVAGLFAGIGGFEHGFHLAGHETVLLCEIRSGAQAVLREKFPDVRIEPDVRELATIPKGVDILCAGFPCQDLSQAGRTTGLAGEQSGLIHSVFRTLRKSIRTKPQFLVLENVPFMLQLHGGAAMRTILDEVEDLGYRWAYRVVDSFSFGLPQRRERVFLVASRGDVRPEDVLLSEDHPLSRPQTSLGRIAHGFYWTEGKGGLGWAVDSVPTLKNGSTIGIASPPAVLMPDLTVVTPSIRDAEAMQGFERGWTEIAESVERSSARWSLVGSAVSVPVAQWIGERLGHPTPYEPIRLAKLEAHGKLPKAAFGSKGKRFEVGVSCDPVGVRPPALAAFLELPRKPLSARATAGFYSRATHPETRLRFADGFIDSVKRHLASMSPAHGSAD